MTINADNDGTTMKVDYNTAAENITIFEGLAYMNIPKEVFEHLNHQFSSGSVTLVSVAYKGSKLFSRLSAKNAKGGAYCSPSKFPMCISLFHIAGFYVRKFRLSDAIFEYRLDANI